MHTDFVNLRTAKVFAAELAGNSAFAMLMVAIANADPQIYNAMVGRSFDDAARESR
ncbi:hypothetical protein [Burkholderia sp. PAMC 26561]|uniref:hypothetical protein n=1 Tax=Burkholderia sp. PAMC 26561 TaxID=1795043 RepID=UPI0013C43617|nr:hypothetical protein [Burkholderia sp. PAMC 26561]